MRLTAIIGSSILLVLLVGFGLSAQSPSAADDDVFQAVRQNDLVALRKAVEAHGTNQQDRAGLTPLVSATAFGTPEAVDTLLALGADVNGTAIGGITPLHVAWHNAAIATKLIARGATVDARTQLGATPLLVAASANDTVDVATQLLAGGADPNAADGRGVTPLIAAASVGNSATAMLLLRHGAAPDAYASPGIGQKNVTPLMGAAMNADLALARALLTSKPEINRRAPDNDGTVKNGTVSLGNFTALHLAAASQSPEMVRLLVRAGATVDAADIRGFTPLLWAVASDHPNAAVARALVQAGADVKAPAKSGDTPTDWARRYNNPSILSVLNLRPSPVRTLTANSPRPPDTREAVGRALPLLRTASARVMTDGGCVACHAQPLNLMASVLAASRGWIAEVDQASLTQIQQQVNSGLSASLQGRETGGQPDTIAFSVLALATAKVPPSTATDAFALYLAAKQRAAGNWHALTGRAPMQDGDITRTAMAIRVMSAYGSPARRQQFNARIAKAARWLDAQQPLTTEERVMQLLGLSWANAGKSKSSLRLRELLRLQRPDGGWGQSPDLASDAYATGEVLYALNALDASSSAAVRRGVEFLVRSQADDGSWHVTSRALKIQPYFESGFPYGHDQWISQAGSSWAVIGLAASSSVSQNHTASR